MLSVETIFYSPIEKRELADKQKIKFASVYGMTYLIIKRGFYNIIKSI
jgi:hypothetical protein